MTSYAQLVLIVEFVWLLCVATKPSPTITQLEPGKENCCRASTGSVHGMSFFAMLRSGKRDSFPETPSSKAANNYGFSKTGTN